MSFVADCYKVMCVAELKKALAAESRDILDFNHQLNTNQAFVYKLTSGKVVLLPNSLIDTSDGIIFDSQNCFERYRDEDRFPIENEMKTIEEMFQSDILCLDSKLPEIMRRFASFHKFDLDTGSISSLLQVVKSSKSTNSHDYRFSSVITLGEFIRKCNNGHWILLKSYGTFNPYYTPGILYPSGSVLILRNVASHYFDNSTITLEGFSRLPFIQAPTLKLGSAAFHNTFRGYRILDEK